MKMSMGQIGRRLLGLTVAGVALAAGGAAFAELGQPAPWEWTLQESATQVMDYITWFHTWLFVTITVITLFVLALLVIVVVKFNAKANPVPSKTTHNTLIEVAWTLIPVLILVGIAVPSFRLLFLQLDLPKADLTVKATKTGMFYGQCSELCGKDHAFMPIAIRVVSDQEFATWVEGAKKKYATNPANTFAAAGAAAP